VNWGNLCSCMGTVISPLQGYRACFRSRRSSAATEFIEWDLESREPLGECKSFDFLGSYVSFQCKASDLTFLFSSSCFKRIPTRPWFRRDHLCENHAATTNPQPPRLPGLDTGKFSVRCLHAYRSHK
jgi:hypothetical protein